MSKLEDFLGKYSKSVSKYEFQKYEDWADEVELTAEERRLYGDEPSFDDIYKLLLHLLDGNAQAVQEVLEASGLLAENGVVVTSVSKITLRQISNILEGRSRDKKDASILPHKIGAVDTPYVSKWRGNGPGRFNNR